jgi:hypothetical protein
MQAGRISHVIDDADSESTSQCANIKSRKDPKKRCTNLAVHGEYCGIHYKHPRPWCPASPASIAARVKSRHKRTDHALRKQKNPELIQKIIKWWRFYTGLRQRRLHGPAYWTRALCTNDADFFSTDAMNDISGVTFYSYKDIDNHIYGFDIRSIHTLLYRARTAGEHASNPFTRAPFPLFVPRQVGALVRALMRRKLPTEWAPLAPPTPEQQIRMKIVDAFSKIDELNYYSSPDWFLELSLDGHRQFYIALFDIWTHRANLSITQKNTIVPGFASRLFRTPRWAVADMTLEGLQRLNLAVIRMMISSATDRNDRILGAMYVVSALTLVCDAARIAYPWLHESVVEIPAPADVLARERRPALANLLGIGWLQDILALREAVEAAVPAPRPAAAPIPPLALPPPAENANNDMENS